MSGELARPGSKTKIGNHTFRATGITAYLKNSGTLENAANMANHASTRTTQLYDRRSDDVSLGEVERIVIWCLAGNRSMRFAMRIYPCEFELPDDWLADDGWLVDGQEEFQSAGNVSLSDSIQPPMKNCLYRRKSP